jgi:hypothetical protein
MYGKEYIKRPADYYVRKDPNIMQWSGLIGIGIATILLTCCTGGLAVMLRWRSYQHELAAIKAGQYLSIVGYQRLCQMTERASLLITLAALFIGIAGALLASFYLFTPTLLSRSSFLIGLLFCIFIAPNLIIPRLLYDLLGIFWVDTPALITFHGSSIEPMQALILGIKSSVIGPLPNERRFKVGPSPSLPMLLFLEALGLLYYFHLPSLLWLMALAAASWSICYPLGTRYVIAWTTQTIPIEQSSWASLVLHIDEWARAADIKLQDIRIHTMIRTACSDGIVWGIFRPMLLLNNVFLAHSDWRQQEALLAWLIGLLHRRVSVTYLWLNNSLLVIIWTLLATMVALLASLSTPRPLPLALIALATFTIIYTAMILVAHRKIQHDYFAADHFAVKQTSDPLALIVALHTIHTLNTYSPQLPPLMVKRIIALYQLLQQPDSPNHWTHDPVPSLLPFSLAEKLLTTPLYQIESATTHSLEPTNVIHLHDYKTGKRATNDGQSGNEPST